MNARATAARIVQAVLDRGRSLDAALADFPKRDALVQELAYGVARYAETLNAIAARLLDRPIKDADRDLHALILVGLYQLFFQRIAPHAAVDETVKATKAIGKPWASGLVNAVLRAALRTQSTIRADVERDPRLRFSLPAWLLDRLRTDWPADWEAIAHASLARPPMSLRVNARRMTREAYLAALADAGMAAAPIPETEQGITLAAPCPVAMLPGFADGWVSVQDGAAQLAAPLLDIPAGARVLDAAAAPGGKACHILERHPDCTLVAVDVDEGRLTRVQENLSRLHLSATLVQGDATRPASWWDGRHFDRVLLDAPCSGTGVIRRHPDIKIHRRASDIAALALTQGEMLDGLWPLLAPGGKLLYVTCSILPAENDAVVGAFLARTPDARSSGPLLPWAHGRECGAQILPGERGPGNTGPAEQGMDGFYFSLLEKIPAQ
jgi:16S rRNA (cytosine967-C5)-methyltransferase